MTAGGNTMAYIYDAGGNKLRKVYGSSTTNDYITGIHYEGGVFTFVQPPEGRVTKATGADPVYSYEYTLSDYLGNGRVYFDGLIMPNSVVAIPSQPNLSLYNGGSEWQND